MKLCDVLFYFVPMFVAFVYTGIGIYYAYKGRGCSSILTVGSWGELLIYCIIAVIPLANLLAVIACTFGLIAESGILSKPLFPRK